MIRAAARLVPEEGAASSVAIGINSFPGFFFDSSSNTFMLYLAKLKCELEHHPQKFSTVQTLLSHVSASNARYFPSGEGSGLTSHWRRPPCNSRVTVPVGVM